MTQRRSLSDSSVTEWSLATLHTHSWMRGLQFGGGTYRLTISPACYTDKVLIKIMPLVIKEYIRHQH